MNCDETLALKDLMTKVMSDTADDEADDDSRTSYFPESADLKDDAALLDHEQHQTELFEMRQKQVARDLAIENLQREQATSKAEEVELQFKLKKDTTHSNIRIEY
jgi:hypothetical protein